MSTRRYFTSPVGRLLSGDVFTPNDKDFQGNKLKDREGKDKVEYFVAIAFPKSDPLTEPMLDELRAAAHEGFPAMFANGAQPAKFAWKFVDGDSQVPSEVKGVKPCDRDGYPGHMVVSFSTKFPVEAYDAQSPPVRILDENAIKRGYWVRVTGSVEANGSPVNSGLFVSHSMVQLVYFGEVISSGPSASEAFAAPPTAMPAGASTTPLAPSGGLPGGAPSAPPAGAAPPAPSQSAPTGAAPAPTPGFGAPSTVAPAPPPPAPPGPQMTSGCPHTYEALKTAGWTDDAMRTAGHLV